MIGKKQLVYIVIIGYILSLLLIGVVFVNVHNYRGLADATIVDLFKKGGPSSGGSKSTFVTYEFSVGDEIVRASHQVFSKNGKDIGDRKWISYNLDKPTMIENELATNTAIVLTIFIFVFNGLLIGIIVQRNNKNKYDDKKNSY